MSDKEKIPVLLRGAAHETATPAAAPQTAALLRPQPESEEWHKQQLGAGLRAVYVALIPHKLTEAKHVAQMEPEKVQAMSMLQIQHEARNTRAAIAWLTENGTLPTAFRTAAPCQQFDKAYDGLLAFERTKWARYEAYRGTPSPHAFTPLRPAIDLTVH